MKGKPKKKREVENYKLLQTSWKHQGRVFFEESTLHGVRYIAESGRPLFEKLMWFVCVAIGAIATVVIIVSLWEKFQTNPTITGLDTDFHTWDVPFPAITLCQDAPSNRSRIEDYLASVPDSSENMAAFLTDLTKLSFANLKEFKQYTNQKWVPDDTDLKKFSFELMNPCEAVFTECEFKAELFNCCDSFFPVFTESGYCYTFNARHYEKMVPWSAEKLPNFDIKYIKETDVKWAMKFFVHLGIDTKFAVYIHNSDEIPGTDVKPQHLWDFRINRMLFSVKQTYTTDDAHQLSIKQRHCIFENEIKLKTEIYTYTGCTQQCRMDKSMRLCGCVPHFYNSDVHRSYRTCKIQELACVADNLQQIVNVDSCRCQLGCANTVYEIEKLNEIPSDGGWGTVAANLETEFVSWPMVMYKREVLFGWVDLLVSFGGIAGLFLGFSLLSGVEILYYFTIRACCMVYQERDELVRLREEDKHKKKTDTDLSLVPYFVSKPKESVGKNLFTKVNHRDHIRRNQTKIHRDDYVSFPSNLEPMKVKTINPRHKIVVPPFGIEFTN